MPKFDKPGRDPLAYAFEPGPADYDTLRKELAKYHYQEFNGRRYGKFHQAMHHMGIIRIEDGEVFVINPKEYTKYISMWSKIQAKDDAELASIIDSNPEERKAWEKKRDAYFEEMRGIVTRNREKVVSRA